MPDTLPREVLQVPSELEWLRAQYESAAPRRILEIGCWEGGTLYEWFKGEPDVVVAVDLEHRNPDAYEDWRPEGTELVVVSGDSKSRMVAAAVAEYAPYDWVFIDGDHGEEYVRSDVELCLPFVQKGGRMLLHDIVDLSITPDVAGPEIVLRELEKRGRKVSRFVDPKPESWGHGLGLVEL